MTQRSRLRLAAVALHAGVAYRAGGLLLEPEHRTAYDLPSIAVAGTGKRVGKTAVAGQLARVARDLVAPGEVVIVAMGRGGPAAPELVEPGCGRPAGAARQVARRPARRVRLPRGRAAGGRDRHRLPALRGGLAGDVVHSTVAEGAALAAARAPALTIFEGSGASLPPVQRQPHAARHVGGRRPRGGARLPRPLPAAAGRRRAGGRATAATRHSRRGSATCAPASRSCRATWYRSRRPTVAGPARGGVHDGARRHPRRAARGSDRAARCRGGARIRRPRRPAGAAGRDRRRSTPTCS